MALRCVVKQIYISLNDKVLPSSSKYCTSWAASTLSGLSLFGDKFVNYLDINNKINVYLFELISSRLYFNVV